MDKLDKSLIKINEQIEELKNEGSTKFIEFEGSIGEIFNQVENLKFDVNLNRKRIWKLFKIYFSHLMSGNMILLML